MGVWVALGAPETIPKGGGLSPPPFNMVSGAPGAIKTPKVCESRLGCGEISNKIAAWVLEDRVLVTDDPGVSTDSGKLNETPVKAKESGDDEVTPDKIDGPTNVGAKSRFALEKPERPQRIERPSAYFEFSRRTAYMNVDSVRFESSDWFLSRPELGDKSPVHVRFLVHSKTVVAHLNGIWPGALAIGTNPGTDSKPKHSPMCRVWKAIRS